MRVRIRVQFRITCFSLSVGQPDSAPCTSFSTACGDTRHDQEAHASEPGTLLHNLTLYRKSLILFELNFNNPICYNNIDAYILTCNSQPVNEALPGQHAQSHSKHICSVKKKTLQSAYTYNISLLLCHQLDTTDFNFSNKLQHLINCSLKSVYTVCFI